MQYISNYMLSYQSVGSSKLETSAIKTFAIEFPLQFHSWTAVLVSDFIGNNIVERFFAAMLPLFLHEQEKRGGKSQTIFMWDENLFPFIA